MSEDEKKKDEYIATGANPRVERAPVDVDPESTKPLVHAVKEFGRTRADVSPVLKKIIADGENLVSKDMVERIEQAQSEESKDPAARPEVSPLPQAPVAASVPENLPVNLQKIIY